jgi:hypothetical protein
MTAHLEDVSNIGALDVKQDKQILLLSYSFELVNLLLVQIHSHRLSKKHQGYPQSLCSGNSNPLEPRGIDGTCIGVVNRIQDSIGTIIGVAWSLHCPHFFEDPRHAYGVWILIPSLVSPRFVTLGLQVGIEVSLYATLFLLFY